MMVADPKDTARGLRARAAEYEERASAEHRDGNVAEADRLRKMARMLRQGALDMEIGG